MCSDRPDSQKTRLVAHQVVSWHVLSCTKIKKTMRPRAFCTALNKHGAGWKGGEQSDVTGAMLLLPLSPTHACSLSHSSHQVKCLERYKGVFGLWWDVNSLHGQRDEGSPPLPSLPSAGLLGTKQQRPSWAAGGRNLAVNEAPFPDHAKSHHCLRAASVQCRG